MFNNNYNAREIMEAIKAAEQAMQQAEQNRLMAIEYHMTELKELGADMNHTTTNVNININKGKIIEITKEVEVPVTKEVVVDNTNEEYIEQLLKDLQNRNERIEQLKEQLEKEQQDYKDLEAQALEELEHANKEIKQLRDEVKVYKGMVAGYEAQLQNKDLIIESSERQIEEQEIEIMTLEEQNSFLEGKIIGLQNELKEKPQVKTVYVEVEAEHLEEGPVEETKRAFNLAYEELESHDGAKMRVTDLDAGITFYALLGIRKSDGSFYNKPAYSIDNKKYDRTPSVFCKYYKYDEQIVEHLMNRINDKRVKKNTAKVNNATKVTKETDEQEIVVNVTNNNHKPGETWTVKASDIFGSENTDDEDILGDTDEMEFF